MTNTSGPGGPPPDTAPPGVSHPDEAAGTRPLRPMAAGPAPQETASADAPPGADDGNGPAQDSPEAPETKEKNKIFEGVRLKARLMMAEQELDKLRGEVEQLRGAPADFQDKNMRLLAEMENLRRRTERERADTAKFAIARFARDVLTVADNFQRAIDTAPPEVSHLDGPLQSFYEGVLLTGRELLNVLERNGVKQMDPTGERFDPNLHQAMMQVDNADVPSGTVMQTFQPAYMIEDRILRPAMVVVSRGGPKLQKPDIAETPDVLHSGEMGGNGSTNAGPTASGQPQDAPPDPTRGGGSA